MQSIDTENGTIQNAMLFEPDSIFSVTGKIEEVPPERVNFEFKGAFLRDGDKKPFNLPPFGRGW